MPAEALNLPPPTYVQEHDDAASDSSVPTQLQILIVPAADSLQFQQGYLGADGERAAIEGELQIKGAEEGRWRKVTIDLRSAESAYEHSIELMQTELVLYESGDPDTPLPSSFSFAIPLTDDAPQCMHTPQSSLSYVLTATLYPADDAPPLSKALEVHTRRFISHAHSLAVSPVKQALDSPARVEVEIPRTTFIAVEPVPIYVTVPSPPRALVVEQGLRLRNIKAELIRTVRVKHGAHEDEGGEALEVDIPSDTDEDTEDEDAHGDGPPLGLSLPSSHEKNAQASSSSSAYPHYALHRTGSSYKTVISRSGAMCRFHSSRPVQLRFLLHQSSPASSPADTTRPLPSGEFGISGSDTECASISQSTLLHSTAFRIRIHATFRNMSNHTERVSTIAIPISFLPPPAPLPEVEESVDSAYHKKHDRPPTRTIRSEDAEAAPHYEQGQAGPSGAPPPFEERDAPPPFFSEPSTSTRLPTFLESEQEVFVPGAEAGAVATARRSLPQYLIDGEGVLFGFPASAQFSGHSDDVERAPTPPPTLEMATRDANVTELAGINLESSAHAMQALGLALQQADEAASGEHPPPPPPMDDPLDPPPSIHSEYRSREGVPHQMVGISSVASNAPVLPPPRAAGSLRPTSLANAPPPYLIPETDGENEQVTRPPPYVDLMPSAHDA
ncbi:hypothetical protein FA95DRAFT_1539863 [Auriscalpium vulgare]|uniref:Uncharacterized protein n=1 Tax=Auriscalpium vulgare TaxID=40419 RepID=A0ACB8RXL9_9AGAM|nr:hypothetical protein FA95DRAFT_1539863 [Auriscalpium vulgare]